MFGDDQGRGGCACRKSRSRSSRAFAAYLPPTPPAAVGLLRLALDVVDHVLGEVSHLLAGKFPSVSAPPPPLFRLEGAVLLSYCCFRLEHTRGCTTLEFLTIHPKI